MTTYICLFVFILFTVSIECNNSTANQIGCTEMMCHSNDHTLTICKVEVLQIITSVVLINTTRVSDELCNPHDDANGTKIHHEGVYGFYENHIWVDDGCRATFNVCGFQGNDMACTGKECESHDFKPNICTVKVIERITSLEILILASDSPCTFYDGPPIGEYGFNDTYIWVDHGCRANFTVCGCAAHLLSSSTAASKATTITEFLTPTATDSVSTIHTLTTKHVSPKDSIMLPTTYSYSLSVTTSMAVLTKPVSQKVSVKLPPTYIYSLSVTTSMVVSTLQNVSRNKAIKQNFVNKSGLSVDTLIGITFGSAAGLAILGGGTFLLYRSVSRNMVSPE